MKGFVFRTLFSIMLIGAGLGALLVWDFRHFFATALPVKEKQLVMVEPGASFSQVARRMAANGVLRWPHHAEYLSLRARLTGKADRLQVGEYSVEPGMTAADLLGKLISGDSVQHKLTLIEGWNFHQMIRVLDKHSALDHKLESLDAEAVMKALGKPGEHPEGRFFPDTYSFTRGMSDIQVLQRAYQQMEKVLQDEWGLRAEGLPYKTPYEALIMASIVEKETGVARERAEIAGVFVRRLQKGMLLQTDPTVIYGIGPGFDGNIRLRDLKRDTPYNTYTRAGLPPTPICMPGREAIHAALHPADGKTLYFVSKGDGSHQFSETLEQHNAAVRKYQLKR